MLVDPVSLSADHAKKIGRDLARKFALSFFGAVGASLGAKLVDFVMGDEDPDEDEPEDGDDDSGGDE